MPILKLETSRVFGTDGSGNQKKIWVGETLIKLNSKHREANKEVSAYMLGRAFGIDTLEYKRGEYLYQGNKYIGCECKRYTKSGEISVPIIDIINAYNVEIPRSMSAQEYFKVVIDCVCEYTGIPKQLIVKNTMQMLVFDYIICNPDRHLTNFEYIYNEQTKKWRLAPLYDHGQSFLCRDGGLSVEQINNRIQKLKMRPFSSNRYKNLIDIETAKKITQAFIRNVKDKHGGLNNIPINEFHRKVAKMQIEHLMNR